MFVHVSRCLIYKVHSAISAARSQSSLFIISHQVSFVKNFFHVLQNFLRFRSALIVFSLAANSFILAQLHLFVKNFFRSFSKSFLTYIRFAVTLSSARIYYQSKSRLSTPFFEFLQIILWLLLVVLIAAESPNIQPRPVPMHSRRSSRSQSAARTSARQAPSFPMAF